MQGNRRLLGVSGVRCALDPGQGGGGGDPGCTGGRHLRTEGRNHRVGPRGCLRSPGSPCSALSKLCAAPPRGWHTPGHHGTPLGEAQDTRGAGGEGQHHNSSLLSPVSSLPQCPVPIGCPRPSRGLGFVLEFGLIFQED